MKDKDSSGFRPVSSNRLSSGIKIGEINTRANSPAKAVDSVLSELSKTKESIEKITDAATTRIEVIKHNEMAARVKVEDLDEALKLASGLKLNIKEKEDEAMAAHDVNLKAIKQLLE